MVSYSLSRRTAAEFLGTLILLATVVGSGIMGERLSGGNDAIALLGNTIPTGAILVVLILMFGPITDMTIKSLPAPEKPPLDLADLGYHFHMARIRNIHPAKEDQNMP